METFTVHGERHEYPFSYCTATDVEKSWYRAEVAKDELRKRTEKELKGLPRREKVRRYARNLGLELAAAGIEALFAPLRLGGMTVTAEGIRDRKEPTYLGWKRQERLSEAYGGLFSLNKSR